VRLLQFLPALVLALGITGAADMVSGVVR